MKKVIYTLVLLLVACLSEAQLLYKISGNGLEKPSYIVGTFHMEDARFVSQIAGAEQALAEVEQVCGEVPFEDMFNPDSLAMMSVAMRLPEGQTLKDVLTPKQMQQVDQLMKEQMGVALTNPLMFSQMGNMTPASLETSLTLYMYILRNQGAFDPLNGIDNYFQKQAMAAGKPVVGLESVSLQVQILYGRTPMKQQVKQLMSFVRHKEDQVKSITTIVEAYHAQDLERIGKLVKSSKSSASLIDDRNAEWVRLMPSIMADKSTFFAVGAGHLPGKKGVLELLRTAGYTVEAVTE